MFPRGLTRMKVFFVYKILKKKLNTKPLNPKKYSIENPENPVPREWHAGFRKRRFLPILAIDFHNESFFTKNN